MDPATVILEDPPLLLGSLCEARATKGYENLLVISLDTQTSRGGSGITRVRFSLEDSRECFSRDLLGVLVATEALIRHWRDEMGHPVLVHCREGKSRSPAIVLYYLMARFGDDKTLGSLQDYISSRRKVRWRPETIEIIKTNARI